jgi:hypothetical protein
MTAWHGEKIAETIERESVEARQADDRDDLL